MYFEERQVQELLQQIDRKFSRYVIMFDTIPHWFSNMTMRGFKKTKHYTAPPMPWGIDANEIEPKVRSWVPGVDHVEQAGYKFPRGLWKFMATTLNFIPVLRNKKPCMVLIKKGI